MNFFCFFLWLNCIFLLHYKSKNVNILNAMIIILLYKGDIIMNKKPILSKRPIKLIAFILVCLIAITLTGCDSSNKRPSGNIDLNAEYASAGGYSVTVGDVYNKLRYNAMDYVENQVYNFLYEEEINTLKSNLTNYEEQFHHAILHDVYDVHDEEDLEGLSEAAKNKAISKYVDKMYQKGFVVNADEIKADKFDTVYLFDDIPELENAILEYKKLKQI